MKLTNFSKFARQYARFSTYSALAFVASWGWSSGAIIDAAGTLSGKSRGLCVRLVENGFLKSHPWNRSNHIKNYYTITKSGIEFATENQDWAREFAKANGYPFSTMPDKIPSFKSHSAVHDLYCQIICARDLIKNEEANGRAITYYATPDLYGNFAAGQKVPDLIIERDHYIDAIEFENSKKSRPELLNFVNHYYHWSGRKGGEKLRRVFVWCINQEIANQFKKIWQPGQLVGPCSKNAAGLWVQDSVLGTRIDDSPRQRSVYIQTVHFGMDGLLRDLGMRGKLEKREAQIADEYV